MTMTSSVRVTHDIDASVIGAIVFVKQRGSLTASYVPGTTGEEVTVADARRAVTALLDIIDIRSLPEAQHGS